MEDAQAPSGSCGTPGGRRYKHGNSCLWVLRPHHLRSKARTLCGRCSGQEPATRRLGAEFTLLGSCPHHNEDLKG